MKLRSAPLDDVHLEALLAVDAAGGRIGRALRWAVHGIYRLHTQFLNSLIWLVPKAAAKQQTYPELGSEPFHITPAELADEWGPR